MPDEPLYREVQRLRQWWAFGLVGLLSALLCWGFLTQIVGGRPWGGRPAPDPILWALISLFGLGLPAFLLVLRLHTEVWPDHVRVGWNLLPRRRIPLADLRGVETTTYRPFRDYGGWGMRWSLRHGRAYTANGTRGVRLHLAVGKPVLLGSDHPEDLAAAIERARGLFE